MKNKKTIPLAEKDWMQTETNTLTEESVAYLESIKTNYHKLGEQCKEVLQLFYFKKESMKQIAARFSWTEASAKNNKYRCLQKLREMVKAK